MRKFLLGLAVVAGFGLLGPASVYARGGHGPSHSGTVVVVTSVPSGVRGNSFVAGPSFGSRRGPSSFYRTRQPYWYAPVWLSAYGCYGYYCPNTYTYYYWCAPYQCYYPVSYCPTGSYSYNGPPNNTYNYNSINTNTNTNVNGPGVPVSAPAP